MNSYFDKWTLIKKLIMLKSTEKKTNVNILSCALDKIIQVFIFKLVMMRSSTGLF